MVDETLPLAARPTRAARTDGAGAKVRRFLGSSQIGLALVGLVILGSLLSPDFLTAGNLRNLLNQTSILGVLALGQFLVVLIGGFDLSVAAVLALSAVLVATIAPHHGPVPAAGAALAAGLAMGALSGVAATLGRVPPMIATLGVAGIARGLAFVVTERSVLVPFGMVRPLQVTLGIFTTTSIAWVALTLVIAAVLSQTRAGRHLYAIGGNERSARLAGIRVTPLKIATYGLAGGLSGLAGCLIVIRSMSGVPQIGNGWELETIAGIVIGGAQLFGGEGHVVKAMIGVLVYQMIGNIMNLAGLNPYYQDVVKAAVIVSVVGLSVLQSRRRGKRL